MQHICLEKHLGSICLVIESEQDSIVQDISYLVSGIPSLDTNFLAQPYLYNGKEYITAHGLNEYDSQARMYYATIMRTTTMDPQAEKYYHISPYSWCGNNPVNAVDPDGCNPIYDTLGCFLGVNELGLQGEALFIPKEYYSDRMSMDESLQLNQGIDKLSPKALETFRKHYNDLSKRPDWDGYITYKEANEWYRNGSGQTLYADISKLDLSGLLSLGEKYVGQKGSYNMFYISSKIEEGLVYGNLTFKRYPNHQVRAYADKYNFEMHPWRNPLNWSRNVETMIGARIAGQGTPYTIYLYGSQQLTPLLPWIK